MIFSLIFWLCKTMCIVAKITNVATNHGHNHEIPSAISSIWVNSDSQIWHASATL